MNPVGYVGWQLPNYDIDLLLKTFPAHYMTDPKVQDHVMFRTGVGPNCPLPTENIGTVVGYADDDVGVEALVVKIGGTVRHQLAGEFYHITWSLRSGKRPADVTTLLRIGWVKIVPIHIALIPQFFPT